MITSCIFSFLLSIFYQKRKFGILWMGAWYQPPKTVRNESREVVGDSSFFLKGIGALFRKIRGFKVRVTFSKYQGFMRFNRRRIYMLRSFIHMIRVHA